MGQVVKFDHPLIQHKMTLIRDKKTGSKEFRLLVDEVSMLMAYEITRDMPLSEVTIETPVTVTKGQVLAGKKVALVAILRAGLGMVEGMLRMIPAAKIGHIGLYRNPQTHKPVDYFVKLPPDIAEREIIILDPMLATGGSAIRAVQLLKGAGAEKIKFMCLLASPEGVSALQQAYDDITIYAAAVDEGLNEKQYIVPGLGDAGDRLFGT
jgi:uracil phosphoribosyltransferase